LASKGYEYSIDTQGDVFCALVGLFNFGRQYREVDQFNEENLDSIDEEDDILEENRTTITRSAWIDKKRDQITS
jgi:hypothetical protein